MPAKAPATNSTPLDLAMEAREKLVQAFELLEDVLRLLDAIPVDDDNLRAIHHAHEQVSAMVDGSQSSVRVAVDQVVAFTEKVS